MTAKKPANAPTTVVADDPQDRKGRLKNIGGSQSDHWNNTLVNQAGQSLWMKNSSPEERDKQFGATVAALMGIGPRDELEGMLAPQLVAAHNAAMECYRRAMIGEQSFEGRRENLGQANKLSRTYAVLVEALNRHRGKGQQKVTVEHVHVHSGGQAIVGAVETGADVASGNQRHADARAITHAPVTPMWGEDQKRKPVPLAGDAEREMPDAQGELRRRHKDRWRCPALGVDSNRS